MKAKDCGYNSDIYNSNYNFSYVYKRKQNLKEAKELFKKFGTVEYSKSDHYVTIGGIVINGISKLDMKGIINGIN